MTLLQSEADGLVASTRYPVTCGLPNPICARKRPSRLNNLQYSVHTFFGGVSV
jgi:hypothetical protein